jgi:hypothetical protein
MPVIGHLGAASADDDYKNETVPFLQGLKETGYVEGQNVILKNQHHPTTVIINQMPHKTRPATAKSNKCFGCNGTALMGGLSR